MTSATYVLAPSSSSPRCTRAASRAGAVAGAQAERLRTGRQRRTLGHPPESADRTAQELGRRAVEAEASRPEHGDARAGRFDVLDDVRREDDRGVFGDLGDEVAEPH